MTTGNSGELPSTKIMPLGRIQLGFDISSYFCGRQPDSSTADYATRFLAWGVNRGKELVSCFGEMLLTFLPTSRVIARLKRPGVSVYNSMVRGNLQGLECLLQDSKSGPFGHERSILPVMWPEMSIKNSATVCLSSHPVYVFGLPA